MKYIKHYEGFIPKGGLYGAEKGTKVPLSQYGGMIVAVADLKIGDKIKFKKSTSLFRRLMPSFTHKVAGHGEEYFLKNEVYEFVNYWSDFARDSGWDYDKTIAMEFECLESPKSNRIGTKFVFSLRHFPRSLCSKKKTHTHTHARTRTHTHTRTRTQTH
jgi:hypothetical protein